MKRLFNKTKGALRQVRHVRVRKVLIGSDAEPRLSVFRSLKGMVAQLIDDGAGKTLCYVDAKEVKPAKAKAGKEKSEDKTGKVAVSYLMGKLLAEKAKAKGVSRVKFDRGGYRYHGRVKALADGAREGGLIF
ncbi:MAG: 50S ribosomal protein L18 [Candidatus Magasanikbacteria bacterium GW2011_GWA2_40_10]|uniref:Large ribosomal subunit protein uL18 n=1 Tax=Candidatus Magasanikbacteria bacterium GW2011_GWA2_40_10 TaxID=1619037 RepID=A0A0G0SK87_9BACT|nr:MAG: 50S ribosomal protein L18 [Candidatus Magasanikbacteria bacterium GW2011_GWA2_40_10]